MYSSRSNKTGNKKTAAITSKRQQGVAIITALLIVTIATTISITISTRLQLDVRRTGNLVATDQAHIYSLVAEKFLGVILKDTENRDGLTTALIEEGVMAQLLPIGNATIEAEITDLSGCININSLIDANGNLDAVSQTRLNALFTNAGITNNLTQAITDWIDADLTDTTPNGAEDGYYLNLEKPYRAANSPLYSISELRLIRGFENIKDYDSVRKLTFGTANKTLGLYARPALCAFNTSNPTPININTASVEVLESLQQGITQQQIDTIVTDRIANALTSVPAVFTTPANLTTDTSYYLLKTKVTIGNANRLTYSIIYWDGNNASTLSRTQRTL